jgi:hypothetical protein
VKQRTTRTAWWLSAILAVALLGGVGLLLAHGITLGDVDVRVRSTDRWTTGTEGRIACGPGDNSAVTQTLNLGFFAVDITRIYYRHQAPQRQSAPAGMPSSTASSTARS